MYDSRNERSDSRISTFDFLGPINHTCDSNVAMDPSVRESQKHNKSSNLSDHDGIQFRPSKVKNGDEPGVCSPPSWSKSPPRGPVHPKPSFNKPRNSPPSLRVKAIARGQKELMEMVKAMPESLYELSLKDLVDHQKNGSEKQEDEIEVDHQKNDNEKQGDAIEVDQEKSNFSTNKKAFVKKQGSVRRQGSIRRQGSVREQPSLKKVEKKMTRNESNISESGNKGLFLKMVFPMPFGGGNKKKVAKPKTKAKPKESPYAQVSTKLANNTSTNSNTNDKSSKSTKHKEWWKRRYPVASDGSESSGLSSNGSSGSSGSSASNDSSGSSISNNSSRKKGGLLNGCSPFYYNKNKTIVE